MTTTPESGPFPSAVLRARLREVAAAELLASSADPAVARRRAAAVVRGVEDDRDDYWSREAARVLALYLHTGAVAGWTLDDVQIRIDTAPSDDERRELRAALKDSPSASGMLADLDRWTALSGASAAAVAATAAAALDRFRQDPDTALA